MAHPVIICCVIVCSLTLLVHCKSTEQELIREIDDILDTLKETEQNSQNPATTLAEDNSEEKRAIFPSCRSRGRINCPGRFGRICITATQLCDRIPNCPHGVDEAGCTYKKKKSVSTDAEHIINTRGRIGDHCSKGFVPCGGAGSQCIRAEYLCDGFPDCYANSWDEDPQNCGSANCPADLMKCNGTGRCVRRHDMCNDRDDCGDMEDENEANCGTKRCGHSSTKCPGTNLCVPNAYWCDGERECPNGEDEKPSVCAQVPCDGVRCGDGRCIHSDQYCDGFPDCSDGGDEDIDKCGPVRCPRNTEQCGAANYCYSEPRWRTCDGHNDCPNGADEREENCTPIEDEPGYWYNYRSTEEDEKSRLSRLLESIVQHMPPEP